MDFNLEAALAELDTFHNETNELSPLLEDYLRVVAKTGNILFPWNKLQPLLKRKIELVLAEFAKACPPENVPSLPNTETFDFDALKAHMLEAIDSFPNAPFTIQRLCELVVNPRKYYSRTDKYMRGLEKNLLVVSTIDSVVGDNSSRSNSTVMNGSVGFPADASYEEASENANGASMCSATPANGTVLENFASVFPTATRIAAPSNNLQVPEIAESSDFLDAECPVNFDYDVSDSANSHAIQSGSNGIVSDIIADPQVPCEDSEDVEEVSEDTEAIDESTKCLENDVDPENNVDSPSAISDTESPEPLQEPLPQDVPILEPETLPQDVATVETETSPQDVSTVEPEPQPQDASPAEPESQPQDASPAEPEPLPQYASPAEPEPLPHDASPAEPEPLPDDVSPAEPEPLPQVVSPAEPEPLPQDLSTVESEPLSQDVSTAEAEPLSKHVSTAEAEPLSKHVSTAEAESLSKHVSTAEAESLSKDVSTAESESLSKDVSTAEAEPLSKDVSTAEAEPLSKDVSTSEAKPLSKDVSTAEAEPLSKDVSTSEAKPLSKDVSTVEPEPLSQDVSTVETEPLSQDVPTSESELPAVQDNATTSTNDVDEQESPIEPVDSVEQNECDEPTAKRIKLDDSLINDNENNGNASNSVNSVVAIGSIPPSNSRGYDEDEIDAMVIRKIKREYVRSEIENIPPKEVARYKREERNEIIVRRLNREHEINGIENEVGQVPVINKNNEREVKEEHVDIESTNECEGDQKMDEEKSKTSEYEKDSGDEPVAKKMKTFEPCDDSL